MRFVPIKTKEQQTALMLHRNRQLLVLPTLKPGGIVVMDNLPAHKNDEVRGIIRAAGAELY
jgi:transposase